jgi:hypothetical protein
MCTAIFTSCPGRGCRNETAGPRLSPCSRRTGAFPSATPCIPAREYVVSTNSCSQCPKRCAERSQERCRNNIFAGCLPLPGCQSDTEGEEEVDDQLQLSPPKNSEGLPGGDLRVRKERRDSSQRQKLELFFDHNDLGRKANTYDSGLMDNDNETLPSQQSRPPQPEFLIAGAGRRTSSQPPGKRISNEILQQATPLRTKRQGFCGPPRSTRSASLPEEFRQNIPDFPTTPSRRKSLPPMGRNRAPHDVPPMPALPAAEYLLPGPGPQDWEFDSVPFIQIPGHYEFRRDPGAAVEKAPLRKENSSRADLPTSEDADWPLRPEPLRIGNRPRFTQLPAQASAPENPEAQAPPRQFKGENAARRRKRPDSGVTPRSIDLGRPANASTVTVGTRAGTSGGNCKLGVRTGHDGTKDDCCAPLRSIESMYLNMRYDEWITK